MYSYAPVIPKQELVVGNYYKGRCRNATLARWNGKVFIYMRTKFWNTYITSIKAPEDESNFDVFIAVEVEPNPPYEIPLEL